MSEVENVDVVDQAPEGETVKVSISLQDFTAMINIIDIVSQRGAFKGEELESVGRVRNRLVNFVQAASPQQQPAAEEEGASDATEEVVVEEVTTEE
jgi:hypothetical protein